MNNDDDLRLSGLVDRKERTPGPRLRAVLAWQAPGTAPGDRPVPRLGVPEGARKQIVQAFHPSGADLTASFFEPVSEAALADLSAHARDWVLGLAEAATATNSRRAYESDLRYFWTWFCLRFPDQARGGPYYPIARATLIDFLHDHMGFMAPALAQALHVALAQEFADRAEERATQAECQAEQAQGPQRIIAKQNAARARSRAKAAKKRVAEARTKEAPVPVHKPATLRRRIAAVSRAHRDWPQANPARDPLVLKQLRDWEIVLVKLAKEYPTNSEIQRLAGVSKKRAADKEILDKLLATCDHSLRGVRDRAILLVGAASGGRRRSELASMSMSQLAVVGDHYAINLGITKTRQTGDPLPKPVKGAAAAALRDWLVRSGITEGRIFRALSGNDRLRGESISGRAIAKMIQRRAEQAGLVATEFGGHSLRAGFMTQAGIDQIGLANAMQLSDHRSTKTALGYMRLHNSLNNPAADLFGDGDETR